MMGKAEVKENEVFTGRLPERSQPAFDFFTIAPSDADKIAYCRALFVGGGGDVTIKNLNGELVTFKNLPNAFVLPVMFDCVMATNTTATDLVGLV